MINSFTFKCLKTSITRSLIKMMMHTAYLTINRQEDMREINIRLRNVVLIFHKIFPSCDKRTQILT